MPTDILTPSEEFVRLARLQEEFLSCVQSDPRQPLSRALDGASELSRALLPDEKERLTVYRDGYYLRIASTMSQTLFEKASTLAGRELVEGLLLEFLASRTIAAESMPWAVQGFAEYCATHSAAAQLPWLPDLLRAGEGRWDVLTGIDPQPLQGQAPPQLARVRLITPHFWLRSPWRIHAVWEAEGLLPDGWNQPQGLLMCKTGPTVLRHIAVEPEFFDLVDGLHQGKSLLEVLECLPDTLAIDSLQREMTRLAAEGALVNEETDT